MPVASWRRWIPFQRSGREPRGDEADERLRTGERLEKRGDIGRAEEAYRAADAAGSGERASKLGVLLFDVQ
jgi:hypothetical protein